MANKAIPWKEHKLEKWLRVSSSQYYKGGCHGEQEFFLNKIKLKTKIEGGGNGEIIKVKIEGDERLSTNITWA